MMTFDDLDPAAQRLINSSITLSPSGVLALLNDFNIGPEYLPELLFALHEHDKLVIHRWNLENAAGERGVFESALKVARKWPEQAKFRQTDDGSVIFDKFGIYDPHIPMVATTEMFVGLLEAAVADASELIKIAEEGLAQIAAIGNRAPKDRYLLWHALLGFWKDVLRREIRYKSDPYADGDDRPVGPVIDFLCAASREFLPATTRQAIYAFLRRQNLKAAGISKDVRATNSGRNAGLPALDWKLPHVTARPSLKLEGMHVSGILERQRQFLKAGAVCKRYGNLTRMTLFRWTRDERFGFPKPIVIRNVRFWEIGALDAFDARQLRNAARRHTLSEHRASTQDNSRRIARVPAEKGTRCVRTT